MSSGWAHRKFIGARFTDLPPRRPPDTPRARRLRVIISSGFLAAARAQQADRMRRIVVLMGIANDAEAQARAKAD